MVDTVDNEMSASDDALWAMSDDELEAAMQEARSEADQEVDTIEDEGSIEEGVEEEEIVTDDGVEDPEDVEVDIEDDQETDLEETEVKEEVIEDDTEQPDEDSNDVDDDDENENLEDESTKPDGEEEDTQLEEKKDSEDKPTLQTHTYKANGQDFEFTDTEVKEQFGKVFGQAMDYTKKMQEIAPWRKTISALKDNELSHEDVSLMIDVLKGDKDAIASVIQKAGIDTMDLDTTEEVTYKAKDYGRSERELAIDDVVDVISKDPEYKITQHVIDGQWDTKSRATLADNPDYINGLHADIKTGVYDKVSPMAMKMKVLDGNKKSDIEYYMEAGANYYQQQTDAKQVAEDAEQAQIQAESLKAEQAKVEQVRVEEQKKVVEDVKAREAKQKTVKNAAKKRRAAAPTKKAAGKKDVIDYLDSSEEDYDEWYKNVQDKM